MIFRSYYFPYYCFPLKSIIPLVLLCFAVFPLLLCQVRNPLLIWSNEAAVSAHSGSGGRQNQLIYSSTFVQIQRQKLESLEASSSGLLWGDLSRAQASRSVPLQTCSTIIPSEDARWNSCFRFHSSDSLPHYIQMPIHSNPSMTLASVHRLTRRTVELGRCVDAASKRQILATS